MPDGRAETDAFHGVRFLGIGAHPDDLEIMAWHGIFSGLERRAFAGVIIADGAGSPRTGGTEGLSAEALVERRWAEQREAARVGRYAFVASLGLPSTEVRRVPNPSIEQALGDLLSRVRPEVVYTHNMFDAHDTHVAVTLHAIAALRALPPALRPRVVYGCEVWQGLDWLPEPARVAFDVGGRDQLARALLAGYTSQIEGGKRYDVATLGRKHAHATFARSDALDEAEALELAVDLTPLVSDPSLDVRAFSLGLVSRFADTLSARLRRFGV